MELEKLIKKMKVGKNSGVDNIDNFSLKLAAPLIEDALLLLVNVSIRTSCFSRLWKHQLIFPHHEKKDKLLTKNYRPVSHLVEIVQLTEQAVNFQLVEHLQLIICSTGIIMVVWQTTAPPQLSSKFMTRYY